MPTLDVYHIWALMHRLPTQIQAHLKLCNKHPDKCLLCNFVMNKLL